MNRIPFRYLQITPNW